MDDWASFEAEPNYDARQHRRRRDVHLRRLTDGYLPVAMENADQLADYHGAYRARSSTRPRRPVEADRELVREQMIDAGALSYFCVAKDFAHLAGIYGRTTGS